MRTASVVAALLLALAVPPLIRDAPRSMALVRTIGRLGWWARPAGDGGGAGSVD